MKKKFMSLIMALAMILSLAVPAFAGETTTSGDTLAGSNAVEATTDFGAITATPTVDVTLPTGGNSGAEHKVLINPYRLAFVAADGAGSQDGETLNSPGSGTIPQIVSAPLKITNKTKSALKVGMTVKATVADNSGITVSAKTMTGKETAKSVFLFAELLPGVGNDGDEAPTTWTAEADFADLTKLNEKCFPQVIAATGEGKKADIVELLPAATVDNNAVVPNYAFFKVLGTASGNPEQAWTTSDTVNVQIVFKFTPVSPYTVNCYKEDGTTLPTTYTVRHGATANGKMTTTAVTNMPVWIKADYNSTTDKYGAITAVTITDKDGQNPVTATKVDDAGTLWWFKMPAYDVNLKVTSTAAPTS